MYGNLQHVTEPLSLENTRVCYIDGAWKEEDLFMGQWWFCRKNGSRDVMMRLVNFRRSLTPLHAECEALIWKMECMKTFQFSDEVFVTDCCEDGVYLKNDQLSLHIWKNSIAVRFSFRASRSKYTESTKYFGGQVYKWCEEFSFNYVLCRFYPTGLTFWTDWTSLA